jgi:hypothetical protein
VSLAMDRRAVLLADGRLGARGGDVPREEEPQERAELRTMAARVSAAAARSGLAPP